MNRCQQKGNAMKTTLASIFVAAAYTFSPSLLGQTTEDNILFLKQEEKVAHDVYLTLYNLWEHPTFAKIARSEQTHMYAMDKLITLYNLTDTTPAEQGQFTIPELQTLHDELIAMGSNSSEEALAVGVLIEETDIADIQELLPTIDNPTAQFILNRLLRGSENHLAAFNRALEDCVTNPAICEPTMTPQPPTPRPAPRMRRGLR
jgi:hypothetical protein